MGFIRTVALRRASEAIGERIRDRLSEASDEVRSNFPDVHPDPERLLLHQEKIAVMKKVLEAMSPRDRNVLTRFYLHDQKRKQICDEMNLTETQFRLLKSRAKSRFAELIQKRVADQRGVKLLKKLRLRVSRTTASASTATLGA